MTVGALLLCLSGLLAGSPPAAAAGCCQLEFERFTGLPDIGQPRAAAMSPDGRHLYQAMHSWFEPGTGTVGGALRILGLHPRKGTLKVVDTMTSVPATPEAPFVLPVLDPRGVVVSPDGDHVYATAGSAGASGNLLVYARDARSGRLELAQRIVGANALEHLAFGPQGFHLYLGDGARIDVYRRNRRTGVLALAGTVSGVTDMDNVRAIAVSPDGRHAYVASRTAVGAVVIFDRDPLTGLLDGPRAIRHGDPGLEGLESPRALVLGDTGRDLYVSSSGDDSRGVAHYRRDPATGELTFGGIVAEGADRVPGIIGSGELALTPDGAALAVLENSLRWLPDGQRAWQLHLLSRSAQDGHIDHVETHQDGQAGLGRVLSSGDDTRDRSVLALTPDGARVLAVSREGIATFRNAGFAPTPAAMGVAGTLYDGDPLPAGGQVEGLGATVALSPSPDGRNLYAVRPEDYYLPGSLSVVSVDPATGALALVEQLTDADGPPGGLGLDLAFTVAVSPDGRHVYATGFDPSIPGPGYGEPDFSGTLSVFSRDPVDGTLSAVDVYAQGVDGMDGLVGPRAVRFSPDGRHVYVVGATGRGGEREASVALFQRDEDSGALTLVQVVRDGDPPDVRMPRASDLAITPDGRFAYVSAGEVLGLEGAGESLAVFRRDTVTGELTHLATLGDGTDLDRLRSLAVAPDGRHLYALRDVLFLPVEVAHFAIDPRTGMPGLVSVQRDGIAGLRRVSGRTGLALTGDGRRLMVAGSTAATVDGQVVPLAGIAVMRRDTGSGALSVFENALDESLGVTDVTPMVLAPGEEYLYAAGGRWQESAGIVSVALPQGPVLLAPTAGDTLDGPEALVRWDFDGARPRAVTLRVGSAPGEGDVFSRRMGARARSALVKGIPVDGRPLHVTLSARGLPEDTRTVTAASAAPPALVVPADGEQLPQGRVTFRWEDSGQPVTRWELLVGTVAGTGDLYRRSFGKKKRSVRVKGLPEDGRELHVTLRATTAAGELETRTTHLAAVPAPRLSHDAETGFSWTHTDGDDGYRLVVGNVPGGDGLCDSGPLGADVLAVDACALPEDGRELFATLTRTRGALTTTHPLTLAPPLPAPAVVSPAPGSTLDGHTVLFRWDRNGRPATGWEIRVGTRRGRSDLFREKLPGDETQAQVTGLPTLGGEVFVRLGYTIDGRRGFTDTTFAAADLPLPDLVSPSSGAILDGSPVRFYWTDRGHVIVSWRVDIGTAPGASDFRSIRSDGPNDAVTEMYPSEEITELMVPAIPADTTVYARWTYRIAGTRGERTEDVTMTPTAAACCDLSALEPVVDDAGGVDGMEDLKALVVSPDGAHVYVLPGPVLLERDPATGATRYVSRTPGGGQDIVMSADGERIYVADSSRIRVLSRDPVSGAVTELETVTVQATDLALAPGGSHLYAVSYGSVSVLAVSPVDGTLTLEDTLADGTDTPSLLGASDLIAVGGETGPVDVYVAANYDDAVTVFRHDRVAGTFNEIQVLVDDGVDPDFGVEGLDGAEALVASPDGAFVYVNGASYQDGSIAVFTRNSGDGSLAPAAVSQVRNLIYSFQRAALLIPPDGDGGRRLYAVSSGSNGVAVFDRDPASGSLANVTDPPDPAPDNATLVELETGSAAGPRALAADAGGQHLYLGRVGGQGDLDPGVTAYRVNAGDPDPAKALEFVNLVREGDGGIDGLGRVQDVALSPDQRHVYAVALEGKLSVFDYDAASGALVFLQVLRQDDPAMEGLWAPTSVAVSPDGAFVYAASRVEARAGVQVFARDPATGLLTFVANSSLGVFGYGPMTLSTDGRHVYAAVQYRDLLVVLERDAATGLLSEVARYEDGVGGMSGLVQASSIVASADGRNVYVVSENTDTVASFRRDRDTGQLDFLGLARDAEGGIESMHGARELNLSPDGRDAYVWARIDQALVHFRRRDGDGLLQFQGALEIGYIAGLGAGNTAAFDPSTGLLYLAGSAGLMTLARSPASGDLTPGSTTGVAARKTLLMATGSNGRLISADEGAGSLQVLSAGPRLVTPAPGATLSAQSTTFTWNANGVPASGWRLRAGSSPGVSDHCDSGRLPRVARSYTCHGLPRQGESLFVTLAAVLESGEQAVQSAYTAPVLGLPVLASPAPGADVSGSQEFTLDAAGNDIDRWTIVAGTAPGARDLLRDRLPGDATSFTIDDLPVDTDVFVSVEARGTFGRHTRVYQYSPSSAVEPLYPRSASGWGEYVVAGDDALGGSDRACSPGVKGGREACLHGGEHRVFVVPYVESCSGVTAADAIGAFDWECVDDILPVRVVSTGLKGGMHLSDLLEFAPPGFAANRVTVTHPPVAENPGGVTTSDESAWWDNPVQDASAGGRLPDAGTVYVASDAAPLEPFEIVKRQGVSLVIHPQVVLGQAASPGEALVRLERADFAWVEGLLDADGTSFGVVVNRSAWPVLDGVSIAGADTAALHDFAGVTSAGVAMERTRNALLRQVDTDVTGAAGVVLSRTTGSHLLDVGASRADTGVLLSRSSGNLLEGLALAANEADGLALEDRSRDNVVAELTSTSNARDGVVVAGRSDGNRLVQVLARGNGGSGVLVDGSVGTWLAGVTALDNTLDGVTLVDASRSALFAIAAGNNVQDGIRLSGARGGLLQDVAAAHNGGAGLSLSDGAAANVFRGVLRVGSNAGGDCVVEDGSSALESGCVTTGTSDAVVTPEVTLAGSFIGPPSVDDPVNAEPSARMPAGDIEDWVWFQSPWRGWGLDGSFPGPNVRGRCDDDAGGTVCAIRDARLSEGDTGAGGLPALADVVALPTADQPVDMRLRRRERFLAGARELLGDFVGDDDGLCEAREDCLAMPHLGAYQGDGPLQPVGTRSDGVHLFAH